MIRTHSDFDHWIDLIMFYLGKIDYMHNVFEIDVDLREGDEKSL